MSTQYSPMRIGLYVAGVAMTGLFLVAGPAGSPVAKGHGLSSRHRASGNPAGKRVVILMRDGTYQVLEGVMAGNRLILEAGKQTNILLRNEDTIPHEFITPLFTRTEVHFSGDATGIFGREAAGFRLAPGTALTLRLKIPYSRPFTTMYDVAWCSMHGAIQPEGDPMASELLIVATRDTASS